jgi:hypothetical protein
VVGSEKGQAVSREDRILLDIWLAIVVYSVAFFVSMVRR